MINNKSEKYSSKSDGRQMEQSDGRQRLHGAFKGGFSAGYHNTVGSEAGFQPQQYKSNRNEKGSFSQQKLDFMDDEVSEMLISFRIFKNLVQMSLKHLSALWSI